MVPWICTSGWRKIFLRDTRHPYFSIVIPALPGDRRLTRAIRELSKSSFEDFEVIVVQDGKGEPSAELSYWLSQVSHVFIEAEHKGAGASRNRGIRIAAGKYVLFLDSDDFFAPNALKEAYDATQTDAEVVMFSALSFDLQTMKTTTPSWYLNFRGLGNLEELGAFTAERLDPYRFLVSSPAPWLRAVKLEFLNREKLRFAEVPRVNDLIFFLETMVFARSVSASNAQLVVHITGDGNSLSGNSVLHAKARLAQLSSSLGKLKVLDLSESTSESLIRFSLRNFGGAQKDLKASRSTAIIRLLGFVDLWKFGIQKLGFAKTAWILIDEGRR